MRADETVCVFWTRTEGHPTAATISVGALSLLSTCPSYNSTLKLMK